MATAVSADPNLEQFDGILRSLQETLRHVGRFAHNRAVDDPFFGTLETCFASIGRSVVAVQDALHEHLGDDPSGLRARRAVCADIRGTFPSQDERPALTLVPRGGDYA